MAMFVEEAYAALVGADSVLADGSIVNKIGTRLLGLAAHDAELSFYVACGTSKFDLMNYIGRPPILEEKNPSEVVEEIKDVKVRNPYFEVTPANLISAIITEKGAMKPEETQIHMKSMRKYIDSL
jgi:translation initiation factor 2B subunit (eIF-2B alpha/beta/delta family)